MSKTKSESKPIIARKISRPAWWNKHINQFAGGIHLIFIYDSLFAVIVLSILTGMSHWYDGDVYIVHHSLWLILVPFVCNLDIMIFTDVPMEICCSIIVPGDVLFFLLILLILLLLLLPFLLLSFLSILLLPSLLFFIFYFLFVFPFTFLWLYRCLIAERKAKKNKAPLTDRLMAQALALQVE